MAPVKRAFKLVDNAEDLDIDEISSNSLLSFSVDSTALEPTIPAPKRGRGRPAANKVTKPAQARPRRAARSTATEAGNDMRNALAEKSTNGEIQTATRGRKPASRQPSTTEAAGKATAEAGSTSTSTGRGRGRPKTATRDTAATEVALPTMNEHGREVVHGNYPSEIPETQQAGPPMEVDMPEDSLIDDSPDLPVPSRTLSCSPTKRTTGPLDSDAGGAQLRRRIGDLSKKCEAWETKYRDLRQIGVKEAERNFDRLKKQMDERTKAADSLIASLQADLTAHQGQAEEAQLNKRRLDAAETRASELTTALAEARKEVASLTAKLSVSRSAEAAAASSIKVPGSAVKGSKPASRAAAAASSEALQVAQLKEDLYGDLTGIIIRGVKRDETSDAFDCILTGRNGTLHFKLIIDNEDASESYEETQLTYEPQLDDGRDRDLIELLPDYLAGEITFPRSQAAKFLMKLARALEE